MAGRLCFPNQGLAAKTSTIKEALMVARWVFAVMFSSSRIVDF
jgi:hypothetical protein